MNANICSQHLLHWVQEIANSYVDQQQDSKERRDVIAREERRLESTKLRRQEEENQHHNWHLALLSSWISIPLASLAKISHTLDEGKCV